MQKVKLENTEEKTGNGIEHYSLYKGFPMVKLEAGFQLGQKKIAAILANGEELKKFVNGDYDDEIKSLNEGEILVP